jgi:hypothetical protein
MIIFMVFIVIESVSTVIRIYQISPGQVEAMKQLLALSPSQMRALCILALTPLESDGRYSVDSRI